MLLSMVIVAVVGLYLTVMVGVVMYNYWTRKDMELVDDGIDELAELEKAYEELEKQIEARYGAADDN